ncbi:MAG: carbohydrate ABC transporter permease [Cyanobacteria bacterium P01_D01_bin.128]
MKLLRVLAVNAARWLAVGLSLAGAGVVLLPLAAVVWLSFAPTGTTALGGLPNISEWSLVQYRTAWATGQFGLAFWNSALVAIAVTALQIFTSTLAGYALARLRFRGRQGILLGVLATLVIPFQMLVIPIFLVLKWGHLINTYGALILPTAASGFGIFLMRQYFQTLPPELEEAAMLDGANRLQVIWYIIVPLGRPAVVTLFIFTAVGEWNDLFKPLVFTTRPELQTVQLALASFQEAFTNDWPLLMAAAVTVTLPVIGLFLIFQRQFVQGIAATGIKR